MVDTSHHIKPALKILQQGRLVAFPTGTAYGLAADALQGTALQRLRLLKKRPAEKTFTVFMAPEQWDAYLLLTPAERTLLQQAANQPLTLLVQPQPALSHLAQDGLIGLRVIDHPMMAQLAALSSHPLTATSANVSGQEPCYSAADVARTFPGRIDETTYDLSLGYIIDGGQLTPDRISTIVRWREAQLEIVRAGALTLTTLQQLRRPRP